MSSEREQAYLNLINQLLTCPSGEEAQILKTHPELLDNGLVAVMLEEADRLREFGELNNANWLKDFAGILGNGKVDGDFLGGIALKAEADRLLEQGIQQFNISQFREALQSWEQALTIYREIGDRKGEGASLGNLGNAYNSLGQYHRAIEFYEQYLEIARQIGDRKGEAASLGNLGNAYNSLGQYHRAIEFYEQYLEIAREIGFRQGEANSLGNLGLAYYSLGQYHRAIEFHQQYLEISREIGFRQGEAISLGSLGSAYESLGQYQKAIEFHQQYLEISREIGFRQGEANSLGNLGLAYYSLGQYQKAIEFHQQYLEISREIGFRVGESISLNNLGLTFLQTHQLAEAETALRASIAMHETLRSELVSNDHKASIFETQISAYRLLQQVLIAQTRFDEALEISEMGRTRAFVELLRQTLLTTPPQSPLIKGRNKSYLNSSLLSPPLARGGWGGYQDLRKKQTSQSPPLARGGWGGYQFPKSKKSPATETPQ